MMGKFLFFHIAAGANTNHANTHPLFTGPLERQLHISPHLCMSAEHTGWLRFPFRWVWFVFFSHSILDFPIILPL